MDPKEILACAKDLLSDPDRWTKGSMAVDRLGYRVSPNSESACRWCLAGALLRCDPDYRGTVREASAVSVNGRVWGALRATSPDPAESPIGNNDASGMTHARLMWWLDEAKAALAKEER